MIVNSVETDFSQASTLDSKKRLALAIIDFLNTSLKDGTLQAEDAESMEVATSCIADAFHVDPANKSQMSDAVGSQSLLSIYGVYEKLKGKSTASTSGVSSASEARPSTPTANQGQPRTASAPSTAGSTTPESEALKSQGNAAMAQKDYAKAIDLYTKAVAISPANPIYLSNRAAAYSAEHRHSEAVTDAELAVAADPKYTKAWSRLGLARFVLGDARGSMEAYEKGIEAEGHGGSDAMKKGYETAKKKVAEQEKEASAPGSGMAEDIDDAPGSTRGGPAAGGMPDLSALAGMMGGGGSGGGGGGMPDISAMMNNPMFAGMAQNLMNNPQALQGLMNNPQIRQMADRFGLGGGAGGAGGAGSGGSGAGAGGSGGGRGGMPDLASMMQDPSIQEMYV